jgi:hypothetical protein
MEGVLYRFSNQKVLQRFPKRCTGGPVDRQMDGMHNAVRKAKQKRSRPMRPSPNWIGHPIRMGAMQVQILPGAST